MNKTVTVLEKPLLQDFGKICRFCLAITPEMVICKLTFQKLLLTDVLRELFGIEIHPEDKLPQNICSTCIHNLIQCYDFKASCDKSLKILQNVLSTNSIETTKNEPAWTLDVEHIEINAESTIKVEECNLDLNTDIERTSKPNNEAPDKDDLNTDNQRKIKRNNDADKDTTTEVQRSQTKTYECSCGVTFTRKGEYMKHKKVQNHLSKSLTYHTCKICNKTYKYQVFRRHMMTHRGEKPFQCRICLHRFTQKAHLQMHELTHSGKKAFGCTLCPKRFTRKEPLIIHEQMHHTINKSSQEKPTATPTQETHIQEDDNRSIEQSNACETCFVEFNNKNELDEHMLTHVKRENIDQHALDQANEPMLLTHVTEEIVTRQNNESNLTNVYKCLCEKTFTSKMAFFKHRSKENHFQYKTYKQTQNKDKPFECKICSKRFTQRSNMRRHVATHSADYRNYLCPHCGDKFTQGLAYRKHLELTHGRKLDQGFQCEHCLEFFLTKANLKVHMLRHSEKREVCSDCGKSFYTKSALKCHFDIHHANATLYCNVCGKDFKRGVYLRKHMLMHSGVRPYCCTICSKRFAASGHLVKHLSVHSGEKPFVCSYCGRSFPRSYNLKVHVRLHTGEKPYVCEICSEGFYDSNGLKRHKMSHPKLDGAAEDSV